MQYIHWNLFAKRSTGVPREVNLRECVCLNQALRPTGDDTISLQQVYQWPHKKDSCPTKKFFFKKSIFLLAVNNITTHHRLTSASSVQSQAGTILLKEKLSIMRIETLILEQDVSYFFYTWVISSTYECVDGCNPSHKLLSDKCRSVILHHFLECANYDRHTDWPKRHLQTTRIYAHF